MVGIKDPKLSEKLQPDDKLTLETAIQCVCQLEAIKQQQPLLWEEQSSGQVFSLHIFTFKMMLSLTVLDCMDIQYY